MIDPPRGYGRDGHGRFFTDTTQTTMTKLLNLTHATLAEFDSSASRSP